MKFFLFFISLISRLGSQIKNFLYTKKIFKPEKTPLSVISVGNIVFGGSEKTPLVMNLISFLLKEGHKPALISRGYKGRWEQRGGVLSDGRRIQGSWEESGDEPFMVSQNFPKAGIFIGKHRLHSCERARDFGFEVALLDDGFQHRRLHRDLDIVLYDPAEKISLREPLPSLQRANIILVKKDLETKQKNRVKTTFSKASVFEYSVANKGFLRLLSKEKQPADAFRGKKALAFCGIARPERFDTLLENAGMEIVSSFRFPDHYKYHQSSLEKIVSKFSELKPALAVTTEKDAIKISSYNDILKHIPVYYLKIDLDIEEEFYERIKSLKDSENERS